MIKLKKKKSTVFLMFKLRSNHMLRNESRILCASFCIDFVINTCCQICCKLRCFLTSIVLNYSQLCLHKKLSGII